MTSGKLEPRHRNRVTELAGHEGWEGIWPGLLRPTGLNAEQHLPLCTAPGGQGGKGSNRIPAGTVFTGSVGAVCTQTPRSKLLGVY